MSYTVENMDKIILQNAVVTSLASRRQLDGNEHMVIPVIALKEGILKDVFYSKDEIQTFAQSWNGVPVPVNHPKKNGAYVSANSPEYENTVNIGKLFNVNFSDGKLKGEIWINIEKAKRLGYTNIIDWFNDGKMMEVSTGLFGDKVNQQGTIGNETYNYVAKNIRPDHLALLPNQVGACSIDDGCGAMRVNFENAFSGLKDLLNRFLEVNMSEKDKLVGELIANESTPFDEKDKKALMTFDEEMLKKLAPVINKDEDKKPEANEDKEKADKKPEANEDKSSLSNDDRILFDRLKANEAKRISDIQEAVVKGYDHLTKEVVANLSVEALEGLAKGIQKPADYTGRGGAGIQANEPKKRVAPKVIMANVKKDEKTDEEVKADG